MKCPVCASDCVKSARDILATLPTVFLPCAECSMRTLDKRLPLPSMEFGEPCSCGKRFIDEVFAHIWVVMVEEGDLKPADPLIAAGSPLIHPGFAMDRPPFLPEKSLVLLSPRVTKKTAERLMQEVPELRGVVRTGDFVPGLAAADVNAVPRVYELLAGCDVRADVFPLATGPLVMYKQQSLVHIEFPRAGYPKIRSVQQRVGSPPVPYFIDACSGVGTLGLTAACLGVPKVVMNDAWYVSAFWSAFNLEVNREYLSVSRIRIFEQVEDMAKHPVVREPVKIAETEGGQLIEVYQGDFRNLPSVLAPGTPPLTALDLFEKKDLVATGKIRDDWIARVGGEVFIP
ncbi:hypothetical protein [Methanoregula sp.]|uniref:hypothetical protein n=1 Tax=Methanoregula sp. TaxID=2052170 RepID=UPI000CBA6E12|nr:hypothetical protein [Methanoregula sp.]PKG32774.1 MAG: hypothetical protein CW742_06410 [Methanoregula sp.]